MLYNNQTKNNIKILEKEFNKSIYFSKCGIVDFNKKISSNNFNLYEVTLATFVQNNDKKTPYNYSLQKTYAVTNLSDVIIYVSPNIFARSEIKPQKITEIKFICPSTNNSCETNFTDDVKLEFEHLKKYLDTISSQEKSIER